MKKYGQVIKFNGAYGFIKDSDGIEYILLEKNLIDKNICNLDHVEFESDNLSTCEINILVARFIKIVK